VLFRLSVLAPHTPVLPPVPFDRMFDPAAMRFAGDDLADEGVPPLEAELLYEFGSVRGMTSSDIGRMRASYYGLRAYVDAAVGRFLDYLHSEWQRPFIVVFHSDHGNMLGEHSLHEKFCMYEPARQVPFILAGEGVPAGRVEDQLVELVDMAPTLCA
jgi:arylsulfatase A-like enzyme